MIGQGARQQLHMSGKADGTAVASRLGMKAKRNELVRSQCPGVAAPRRTRDLGRRCAFCQVNERATVPAQAQQQQSERSLISPFTTSQPLKLWDFFFSMWMSPVSHVPINPFQRNVLQATLSAQPGW